MDNTKRTLGDFALEEEEFIKLSQEFAMKLGKYVSQEAMKLPLNMIPALILAGAVLRNTEFAWHQMILDVFKESNPKAIPSYKALRKEAMEKYEN